jgi:hypothetical protein
MCARSCISPELDRAGLIAEILTGRPPRELPAPVQRELAALSHRA